MEGACWVDLCFTVNKGYLPACLVAMRQVHLWDISTVLQVIIDNCEMR